MLTRDSVLQRTGDLVTAPMDDDLAMMDIDTGKYFVLDKVAAFIWEQLSSPTRIASLLTTLTAMYDVRPEQCEADVVPFLQQLHTKGLVRVVDA